MIILPRNAVNLLMQIFSIQGSPGLPGRTTTVNQQKSHTKRALHLKHQTNSIQHTGKLLHTGKNLENFQ